MQKLTELQGEKKKTHDSIGVSKPFLKTEILSKKKKTKNNKTYLSQYDLTSVNKLNLIDI